MVANPGKFQVIFLGSSINNNNIIFIVENKNTKSNNEVELLGITIDHKLTFTKHTNNLCNTASKTFENFDKSKENVFLRLKSAISITRFNLKLYSLKITPILCCKAIY